jgi:hypothetical protein
MPDTTIPAHGRIEVKDAKPLFLPDETIQRVVYALTSLAVTPVIKHVRVTAVYDAAGNHLWPPKQP